MESREHRLSATMDDALRREVRLSEKPDFEMANGVECQPQNSS